jgi:hypothetical protein
MADRMLPYRKMSGRLARLTAPQAVFKLPGGGLDCCPVDSPRFSALSASPEWSSRVLGVFSPGVSAAALAAEARA